MKKSSPLDADPAQWKLSKAAKDLWAINPGSWRAAWTRQIGKGQIWSLPIAQHGKRAMAIRLTPGLSLLDSPVEMVEGHDAITYAGRPASAILLAVVHRANAAVPAGWDRLATAWPQVSDEFDVVNRTLGGDGAKPVADLLANEGLHADVLKGGRSIFNVIATFFESLDPSPEQASLRKYARFLQADPMNAAPMPEDTAAWRWAAAHLAFAMRRRAEWEGWRTEAAWAMHLGPAGLDACGLIPMQLLDPSPGTAAKSLESAAQLLVGGEPDLVDPWREDPLWPAVEAIASNAKKYDGLAHLEAARSLDESDQPERAWDALRSATYWSFARSKKVPDPMIEAAALLAKRSGWDDIVSVFEAAF